MGNVEGVDLENTQHLPPTARLGEGFLPFKMSLLCQD
jgi:hypothetical protein